MIKIPPAIGNLLCDREGCEKWDELNHTRIRGSDYYGITDPAWVFLFNLNGQLAYTFCSDICLAEFMNAVERRPVPTLT